MTPTIMAARLTAWTLGDAITPTGFALNGNCNNISFPQPSGSGSFSPTWTFVGTGPVTRHTDGIGYVQAGALKIGGVITDTNARAVYYIDRIGPDLELPMNPQDNPNRTLPSWVEMSGVEDGVPYTVVFAIRYEEPNEAGEVTSQQSAYLAGTVAQSTLRGGRGRADVNAYLAGEGAPAFDEAA